MQPLPSQRLGLPLIRKDCIIQRNSTAMQGILTVLSLLFTWQEQTGKAPAHTLLLPFSKQQE